MLQVCRRLCFLVVLLASAYSLAQDNAVRVGVAIMQNEAGQAVPGNIERDRLVKAINQLKPDKKTHLQVIGVPLQGSTGSEITEEAEQKKCQYVVYTTLTELRTAGDPYQRRPGTMESNPNSQWSSRDPDNQKVDPEFRVTVEYKLVRVGSHDVVASAPYSTQLAMNEIDAVSQVMDRIANAVFGQIKKGAAPMHEQQ
jgi:hypothetical protein